MWEEKRPAYFLNPTCQPCHCALKFTHPIQIAAANLQIIHISSLKNIMTKMGKGKENELSNISKHVTYCILTLITSRETNIPVMEHQLTKLFSYVKCGRLLSLVMN